MHAWIFTRHYSVSIIPNTGSVQLFFYYLLLKNIYCKCYYEINYVCPPADPILFLHQANENEFMLKKHILVLLMWTKTWHAIWRLVVVKILLLIQLGTGRLGICPIRTWDCKWTVRCITIDPQGTLIERTHPPNSANTPHKLSHLLIEPYP